MHSTVGMPGLPGPGRGPAPAPALVSVTGTGWPSAGRPLPAAPGMPMPTPADGPLTGARAARPPLAGERDRSGAWLRNAAAGLAGLAGAAAAVSFSAQYQMADAARHLPVFAGLEAAIPDAAAMVFACLGIALALQGRRAVRTRFLNLAAVGTSVFVNAIAAAPGWRAAAIWVMPPAAYALASDALIGVVRAWTIARHDPRAAAAEETTPLAVLGGAALWLLRLAVAPASTLIGLRAWVIAECPVAPGTRVAPADALPDAPTHARLALSRVRRRDDGRDRPAGPASRQGTKTGRFLAAAEREHGPLAGIPLADVGRISAVLAPRVALHPGAARTALRAAILAARNGAAGDGRQR